MKHNYKMVLQYDGSRFDGWQKQGNTAHTIQGILESTISAYVHEQVDVKGSGRTDQGVHALGQVANFYTLAVINTDEMKLWLNKKLPDTIRITELSEVSLSFHSRKSAVRKTYEYHIWNSTEKNVFAHPYMVTVEDKLDLEKMKTVAKMLCGTHDFIGFSSIKDNKKSTVRTIYSVEIKSNGNEVTISYTGDGFLYHMVRIISGTLIEIGQGKRSLESVVNVLEEKKRSLAGPLAPAQGLFLKLVEYK